MKKIMKKAGVVLTLGRKSFYILALLLVIVIGSIVYLEMNNTSVEKYIDNNYTDAEVQKIDHAENLILFSNGNKRQYIFGKIRKFGRYYFDVNSEFALASEAPDVMIISYMKDIGNVVWGFFNIENEVNKVEIVYKNSQNDSLYAQTILVDDHAYFDFIPKEILNDNFSYVQWLYSLKAYNNEDELVYEVDDRHFIYERNMN